MRNSRSLYYLNMVRVYRSAISPTTMNNNFSFLSYMKIGMVIILYILLHV